MHETTCWIFHVKSWKNMFQSKLKSFSRVLNDEWNASHGCVCRCHGVFDEEKFEFAEMSFELSWKMVKWNEKWSSWNKTDVSTWKFLVWKTNFLQNWVRSSFVERNLICTLTPKLLSHSPKEMEEMRLKESKYGVYIHAWRWMVGQKSLNYLLGSL